MPVRRQPDQRKPHQAAARPDRTAPARSASTGWRSARARCPAASSPDRSICRHGTAARASDHLHGPARAAHAGSRLAGSHAAPPAACTAACSAAASSGPSSSSIELHRVDVGSPAHRRAHGTAAPPAAATAAGCPRSADSSASSRSISPCGQIDQRQIARRPSAGARLRQHGCISAVQRPRTSVSRQIADRRLVEQRAAPTIQFARQPRAVGLIQASAR